MNKNCDRGVSTRPFSQNAPFASRSDLLTLEPRFLSALCFHILTNCFSRNPFLFTTIRIALGCGGLCVLGAPTSVPSVLSPFLPCGPVASVEKGSAGERSNLNGAWMQSGESSETTEVRDIEREKSPGISRLSYLFAVICSLSGNYQKVISHRI